MEILPIPFHHIVLLQSYLYEIFTLEKKCNKSFENTYWYLKAKYSKKEVETVLEFFKSKDILCDCDLINKFDLGEFAVQTMNHHHENLRK